MGRLAGAVSRTSGTGNGGQGPTAASRDLQHQGIIKVIETSKKRPGATSRSLRSRSSFVQPGRPTVVLHAKDTRKFSGTLTIASEPLPPALAHREPRPDMRWQPACANVHYPHDRTPGRRMSALQARCRNSWAWAIQTLGDPQTWLDMPVGHLGLFIAPSAFTGKVLTNATASSSHALSALFRWHGRVDIDVALHRAPPHFHRPRPRPRKSFMVAVFTDTKEQAAFGHGGRQLAVQHEAGPAEHLDLAHRSYP